jgi:hypothetical protein
LLRLYLSSKVDVQVALFCENKSLGGSSLYRSKTSTPHYKHTSTISSCRRPTLQCAHKGTQQTKRFQSTSAPPTKKIKQKGITNTAETEQSADSNSATNQQTATTGKTKQTKSKKVQQEEDSEALEMDETSNQKKLAFDDYNLSEKVVAVRLFHDVNTDVTNLELIDSDLKANWRDSPIELHQNRANGQI